MENLVVTNFMTGLCKIHEIADHGVNLQFESDV